MRAACVSVPVLAAFVAYRLRHPPTTIAYHAESKQKPCRVCPRQGIDSRRRQQPGPGVWRSRRRADFFARGEGAYLFDIDGNRYIDYIGSWGPMILGHAHPQVVEAVQAAAARGTSFGAPTEAESELAELIIEAVPSVEKVRLVSSGTEATMSAIRLARGFTGRDVIVKFAGNYHGHVDSLLVAAGSSAATLAVPNSPGVTAGTAPTRWSWPTTIRPAWKKPFGQHGRRSPA